jgi:hypothetical protein
MWGIACVLLIVLWVKSYRWENNLVWVQGSARNVFSIGSMSGTIAFIFQPGGDSEEQLLPSFCRIQRPVTRRAKSPPSLDLIANDNLTLFRFPIWVVIALVCAIGAAGWLRFSWRFSLRRLLIATMLVAVVLGLIVWLR